MLRIKDDAPDVYEIESGPKVAVGRILCASSGSRVDPTQPSVSSRSSSRSSRYQETPQDPDARSDDEGTGVERAALRPSQARSHFDPARVDASNVDFSDNVSSRKSYKVSSRRRRQEFEGFGKQRVAAPVEDDETYTEKIARLKREVEEVKLEHSKSADESSRTDRDIVQGMLQTLEDLERSEVRSAPQKQSETTDNDQTSNQSSQAQAPAVDDLSRKMPSSEQVNRALRLAADLEERMTALEATLGLPALSVQNQSNVRPIFSQLQTLDRQLMLLNNSTGSSLTAVTSQVESLTKSADTLTNARKQALQAEIELRQHAKTASQTSFSRPISGHSFSHSRPSSYYGAGHRPPTSKGANNGGEENEGSGQLGMEAITQTLLAGEETEQGAQVQKLSEQLPTLEALAPLVPTLLERLRSLHPLHADAAGAAENIEAVEKRQSEMTSELDKWRESLDGLETRLNQGEIKAQGNRETLEKWLKDLEERTESLGQK